MNQQMQNFLEKQKSKSALIGAGIFTVLAIVACTEHAKAKIKYTFKDAPKAGVVAKVNGEDITEDQLIGDAEIEFLQIKKQEYDLKMSQLNKLITERTLNAEAKKEGLANADEYIQKKILKGDVKITDVEFKKFVKEKNIPESNINDQVKDRIYSYLKEQKKNELVQAAVAKLNHGKPVEVYFKPKNTIQIDLGEAPTTGGENAKVTMVMFSDFQCPFCGRAAQTVTEVRKKYGNKIKIAFKQFPLPMHKDAVPAAEASMCIYEQGKEKFWKFHDIAFVNQDKLDTDNLVKHAKAAGADEKKFKECFDSHKFANFVKNDQAYGEKLGVRSTPTFFINGQLLSGAQPLESFTDIIDEELEVTH